MALKAWYKLNGNLSDSSGETSSSSSVSFVDDGLVLGKSFSNTFSPTSRIDINNVVLCGTCSISFRVKILAYPTNGLRLFTFSGSPLTNKPNIYLDGTTICLNTSNGISNPYKIGSTLVESLPLNKWVTVTVIIDGDLNKSFLYLDGIYKGEAVYVSPTQSGVFTIGNFRVGDNAYSFNGYIQDFRIYDHALSTKEIIELAKAKILHLTFDDVIEPTVNTYNQSGILGFITAGTLVAGKTWIESYSDANYLGVKLRKNLGANTVWHGSWGHAPFTIKAGEIYTLSCYCKYEGTKNQSDAPIVLSIRNTDWQTTGMTALSYDVPQPKKEWVRLSATFTSDADRSVIPLIHWEYLNSDDEIMYICNIQLEKKDHKTPYVNGTRATAMVADKSDYGNNTTVDIATTPYFSPECKLGKQGADFSKKFGNTIKVLNFLKPQNLTVSVWANIKAVAFPEYPDRVGHNIYPGNDGFAFISDIGCWVKNSDGRQYLQFSGFKYGEWALYTFTYDSKTGELKAYLNGKLCNSRVLTNKVVVYGGVNDLCLSLELWPTNGIMDDIRIYATALTAAQVKELCEVRGSVDNKGNLFVGDLNIDSALVGAARMDKKGFFNCKKISDHGVVDGLVAWYPLDGDAKDYVGTNHGVVTGALVANGQGQKCYSFDGVDDKIDVTINGFVGGDSPHTISMWLNVSDLTTSRKDPISLGNAAISQYSALDIYSNATNWYNYSNDTNLGESLPLNQWVLVTLTYKGGGCNIINKKMYWNGIEKAQYNYDASVGGLLNLPSNPLLGLGYDRGRNMAFFSGKIQDVRIYNRALTTEEVKINYDITRPDGPRMKVSKSGTVYIKGKIKNNI